MAIELVNVLTRAAAWTAGVIEGLMTAVVGAADPLPALGRSVGPRGFNEVRLAIVGRNRRQIAKALGTPPTACVGFGTVVGGGSGGKAADVVTFWQATTWYYPLDVERQQAIAIRFEGNRAREVDFIGVPTTTSA
jgi:hypothetical protein